MIKSDIRLTGYLPFGSNLYLTMKTTNLLNCCPICVTGEIALARLEDLVQFRPCATGPQPDAPDPYLQGDDLAWIDGPTNLTSCLV